MTNNQSLTISITVNDPKAALDFYQKAFGAEVLFTFELPDGSIAHADLKIGNTAFYLSGEYPEWKALSPLTVGGSPNLLCIQEESCDELFQQALDAGGAVIAPMQDYPWGERGGILVDPFGYRWTVGKKTEEVAPEEIIRRITAGQADQ